jgi:hypothetical protein
MNVQSLQTTAYDDSWGFELARNKANLVKTRMTALKAHLTEYDYAKQTQFDAKRLAFGARAGSALTSRRKSQALNLS